MSKDHKFSNFLSDLLSKDVYFAAYSLPEEDQFQVVIQNHPDIVQFQHFPTTLQEGFVISPFRTEEKVMWIRKDEFISSNQDKFPIIAPLYYDRTFEFTNQVDISKPDYLLRAQKAIDELKEGAIEKMVFSRTIHKKFDRNNLPTLILSLRSQYPETFVFLANFPGQQSLIGASPEVLVSEKKQRCLTMALAGTRISKDASPWTEKEKEEQKYVDDFIFKILENSDLSFERKASREKILSSGLKHLCTEFEFEIQRRDELVDFINKTHPSPAVAGIPRKEAMESIRSLEGYKREFYTGYLGPVNIDNSTQLYVNLRSAKHSDNQLCLYVGGGMTKDSDPLSEWEETERKSQTLLKAVGKSIN